MRIASIQLEIAEQTKERSIQQALHLMEKARGADLLLLPEIWNVGFFSFARYQTEAEEMDGPTVRAIQSKARELNAHVLMGSFVERDGNDYYNTTLLLNPAGEMIGKYRKIHLFGYKSQESSILRRGETVSVIDCPWGRTGLSTCYDLRFPELYRKMVDQRAVFFLVTSAWPAVRLEAWGLFNQARAHENMAYLISCNCAGSSDGRKFAGHSMIVDPWGKIVAEAGEEQGILQAELDPRAVEQIRQDFNPLNDRVLQ